MKVNCWAIYCASTDEFCSRVFKTKKEAKQYYDKYREDFPDTCTVVKITISEGW